MPGISKRLRKFSSAHGDICYWGGEKIDTTVDNHHPHAASREHLIPKSIKIKHTVCGYVLAHREGNSRRSSIDADAFKRLMNGEAVTKYELWPHVYEKLSV